MHHPLFVIVGNYSCNCTGLLFSMIIAVKIRKIWECLNLWFDFNESSKLKLNYVYVKAFPDFSQLYTYNHTKRQSSTITAIICILEILYEQNLKTLKKKSKYY